MESFLVVNPLGRKRQVACMKDWSVLRSLFKKNIRYVIKTCRENKINGEWLKDQLMDNLETL